MPHEYLIRESVFSQPCFSDNWRNWSVLYSTFSRVITMHWTSSMSLSLILPWFWIWCGLSLWYQHILLFSYFESNLKSEVDLKSDVCQSSPLVDLATNADIRVISFGVFQNQGWATFLQLDIARLPCSDSNASEPTSKKHPGHRFIKVLHLQVGILPVQAGELSPVRQELSFSLHGEQGPHLRHVLKLNIHKSNRLQLHLEQILYVYVSF